MAEFREIPLPVDNHLDIIVEDDTAKKVSGRKKKAALTEPAAEKTE